MAKMPFGTTGGRLHNSHPPGGRYGTESVAERAERAAKTPPAVQQQQEGEPNPGNPAPQDADKKQLG